MTPMEANIVASVIGGLLLLSVQYVWSRYILPQIDKGVAIEGIWIADIVFPDGEKSKHRLTLKRFGHAIWGTSICVGEWGEGLRYKVRGTFKNLVLAAEYEVVGNRRLERGSFTLMLVDGGSALRGYLAYFDNDRSRIETTACEWRAEAVPSLTRAQAVVSS